MSDAIRAERVDVTPGGHPVLCQVSFTVARGEFACLVGPNGGGKTTFLRAVLGLVPLAAGRIEVLGASPHAARRRTGYVPQVKGFNRTFPARVVEVIAANRTGRWPLRLAPADRDAARAALARVGGERLLEARLSALSGGELQRAFLARALVNAPELLLLDEPTAGVDARGRGEFLDLLERIAAARELAVVLVTHNSAAVRRLAARVVYLDQTVRAWGPPDEVLDREWDRGGAFSGHDHASRSLCEDE